MAMVNQYVPGREGDLNEGKRSVASTEAGAGSASKLAQVSAALEEKIRTWRTDVASTARSLDDNLHAAAAASASPAPTAISRPALCSFRHSSH